VGSGLAGFTGYLTLRHAGLAAEEIAVLGPDPDPAAAFARRAAAIRQQRMRSESDGHCRPRTFPGLAVRAARRRRSALPLVASACDRYRPPLADFLADVEEARERSGYARSFTSRQVARIRAAPDGFEVDGLGVARHVLVATGHPGLARPPELSDDPRAVHAYEPHEYAARVCVIGAGMAAATEWANALAAGAAVTSVRRRPPLRRPLNVPRPLFSRRGLARYHALDTAGREAFLSELSAPSYPVDRRLDERLARAEDEGRFEVVERPSDEEQVVCATGFLRGYAHDPLLADLVDAHGLATAGGRIVLADDATVPALSDRSRTLALAGVAAQWAFPAADTLAGARYAARGLARRVLACPTR
jgi:cation diffusion facilitator CzcD-associated flavoprotein CzcO